MQEIKREKLILRKEYYIEYMYNSETSSPPYKMIGKFEGLSSFGEKFSNFRRICERYECRYKRSVDLAYHWKYYEINSNTIQNNMENRAYKMIILNIVNDKYFKPIDVL